jgi:phage protein D
MAKAGYFTQCLIKINGAHIPQELMQILDEVVVDASLHMPDMFIIRVQDYDLRWVDDALFNIGNPIEISVETGDELGAHGGLLIKGEITAIEPHFSSSGNHTVLIRGYDRSHRLHRGRKTRTFLKQKDDAVVQKIAGEVGLSSEIDATRVTYDFILQNNQTNMEFLLARASRIGYQVYAAEGKLYFLKGTATLGEGPELALGETLDSFQPSLTAGLQADQVTVKGWDEKGKQPIMAQKPMNGSLNQGGMTKTGGDTAAAAFGGAEMVLTNQPVFSPDEATALATGLSDDISREAIQAEGVCLGDPRIKPGWTVTIKNVGERFKGKYFVTSATHIYNQSGYQTTFSITGRQPNTLTHLLAVDNGQTPQQGSVPGVVTGLVTNLNDPDNLGRVKVKYAWLGDIESDWVRIASPMAGPERGFMYLPEVNDEVLLAFAYGDVHHPYIIGALWNSQDKPPIPNSQAVGGGLVNQRIIKTRSGHVIILDDTAGAEQIIIRDKTEKNEMVIDSAKNSMSIKVDGDFSVDAKGKITLKSQQDMLLETKANGTWNTTGNQKLNATGNLNAEAKANVSVKGIQVTVEGTAQANLKGATVGVQGSALTEVKGALVKIN